MGIFTESIKKNLGILLPVYSAGTAKNHFKNPASISKTKESCTKEPNFSRNSVYSVEDNTLSIINSSNAMFSESEKSEQPRFSLCEEDVEYVSAQVERDSRRYARRF